MLKNDKIMLIAGCSHAAGSEIDGNSDSAYNRYNSFGNLLAVRMGYTPVNIASLGSTNTAIARSVLEWVSQNYRPFNTKLFVLIAWTEVTRIEIPVNRDCQYSLINTNSDWISKTESRYMRVNLGYKGGNDEERRIMPSYHKFISENLEFIELTGLNLVLQLQYFLKSKNIEYLMCNTMGSFSNNEFNKFYFNLIDKSRYMEFDQEDKNFYWYYRNHGYENPKAKYWHHNEIPHRLYADRLFQFLNQ